MQTQIDPDFSALVQLFEATQKGDLAARESLKDWFDERVDSMLGGRDARRQLGTLAYLLSEKQATRNLAPGGRFQDLPNDPNSVASRHWERFQPFCEEIEGGARKTVDEFVIRINALTRYVLLDMARERNLRRKHEQAIEGDIGEVDILEDEEPGEEYRESLEEDRALLRRIFQVLPSRLFLVVVLHRLCQMRKAEIAEILGTTAYYINLDIQRARLILDELDDVEDPPPAP